MIGRVATALGAAAVSALGLRAVGRRAAERLLDAPRTAPGEAALTEGICRPPVGLYG